jgi:hypothetical protein
MIIPSFYRLCWCLLAIPAISCFDSNQSIAKRIADAERNAVEAVPFAAEFCKAFPVHQVTLCGIESRKPYRREFQVKSFAYDRYLLYLVYVVEFRSERDMTVKQFFEPRFRIEELTEIGRAENGNTFLKFGEEFSFTRAEFDKLRQAQFDLPVSGIPLKTNAPVVGFADYTQQLLQRDY